MNPIAGHWTFARIHVVTFPLPLVACRTSQPRAACYCPGLGDRAAQYNKLRYRSREMLHLKRLLASLNKGVLPQGMALSKAASPELHTLQSADEDLLQKACASSVSTDQTTLGQDVPQTTAARKLINKFFGQVSLPSMPFSELQPAQQQQQQLPVANNSAQHSLPAQGCDSTVPGNPFVGCMDMSRVACTGHSFGGATASHAAAETSEFNCVVALDPWWAPLPPDSRALSGWSNGAPLLVIGSEEWNTPDASGNMRCDASRQQAVIQAATGSAKQPVMLDATQPEQALTSEGAQQLPSGHGGGGGAILLVPAFSTHVSFSDIPAVMKEIGGRSLALYRRLVKSKMPPPSSAPAAPAPATSPDSPQGAAPLLPEPEEAIEQYVWATHHFLKARMPHVSSAGGECCTPEREAAQLAAQPASATEVANSTAATGFGPSSADTTQRMGAASLQNDSPVHKDWVKAQKRNTSLLANVGGGNVVRRVFAVAAAEKSAYEQYFLRNAMVLEVHKSMMVVE